MKTKAIETCLRYVDHPNAEMLIKESNKELAELKYEFEMITTMGEEPDYDSLCETAKAELRAAAKAPEVDILEAIKACKPGEVNPIHNSEEFWAALSKEDKPGEVNAVHDDQMDAVMYALKFKDMVNHPKHYNKGRYEVIDIIESILESMELTPVEAMLTSQVVKYIARWKNKNGVEDLKKAEWYLRRLIG